MEYLLKKGVDSEAMDEAGTDVDKKDEEGKTPLNVRSKLWTESRDSKSFIKGRG